VELYPVLRRWLFHLPPERAHNLTLRLLGLMGRIPPAAALLRRLAAVPPHPVKAFGRVFPNPVGLAAGYDKDGVALRGLAALGFGHLEVGTVTLRPQPGNPKPRLFRLPAEQAIINRMGFPSGGASALARRLRKSGLPRGVVLGVNIGRNKETPNERAVEEYLALLDIFAPLADYLTVNISSPNTAGLRDLQHRTALETLLGALHARRQRVSDRAMPILVKLSPDLTPAQLDAALEAVVRSGMDGVILTNTTVARPGVRSHPLAVERGGLSGAPLCKMSEEALRRALRTLNGRLPVISAGGILTPEDARRRLDMGALLVQVYTGLVYRGPLLVRDIVQGLPPKPGSPGVSSSPEVVS